MMMMILKGDCGGLMAVAPAPSSSALPRCCCCSFYPKYLSPSSPILCRHYSNTNNNNNYYYYNKFNTNSSHQLLLVKASASKNQPFFSSSFSSPNSPIPRPSVASMEASSSSSSATQNVSAVDATGDEANVFQLIQAHQEKAARLPPVEEVKTFLYHSLRGVLSTFSHKHEGYLSGSIVDFACDAYGSPILAISSLAVHTKDLLADSKCSLLVAKDPEDRTELVITVHGNGVPVAESEREAVRMAYLARHPDAFWVDFGDFLFIRIEPQIVRYVSGVATAALGTGEFSKEEFRAAQVDPIYQFSKPIVSHMNKDHGEDTKLIVQHSTSVLVDSAYILDVDSLGFNVKAKFQGNDIKLRIPFSQRATDRKDVKTLIIEMLEAAKTQAK